jgi:uncharacterized protein YhjY with autotransporter beta-barrel domain
MRSRLPSRLPWCAALWCGYTGVALAAEPAPRSLDQALIDTLALGRAVGCGPAFGVPDFGFDQAALDTYLAGERDAARLGKELAAICGSSAVASAASLGGSLGSVQTTKTVSQFRMARSRADSRLNARGKRAGLDAPIRLAQLGGAGPSPIDLSVPADDQDVGMFVQIEHESRDRDTTSLEAGYRARIDDAVVGVDFAVPGDWTAGAWLGWHGTDANYRATSVLIGGGNDGFGDSLDAATQAAVCRVGAGGGFDDKGARLGAYVARRFGDAFADLGVQYSRRDYRYQRNVCAIEGNRGPVVADPGSASGFASDGVPIEDIYAGTISGKARLTEWAVSARGGIDFGDERFIWGPRALLTYVHTTIGAYTETGRTSVTNTVESVTGILNTQRSAGDPTGLELSVGRQRRESLQSELQLVAALRHETALGTLVPRVSVSWIHEFKGERESVNVRMAGDLRPTPTYFSYTTDAVDRDKGMLALGLAWLRGADFAADIEVRRLVSDNRFSATSVGLRALWRF